jgi:hypothetical protein
VLRHGGRFGMTVWCGPDLAPSYEMVYRAIKTYGAVGITAPPGADFHQFADRKIASELLSNAGFSDINMVIVESDWTVNRPDDFFRYLRARHSARRYAAGPPASEKSGRYPLRIDRGGAPALW